MKVTKKQAEIVLEEVAAWLGQRGLGEARCQNGRELDWIFRHTDDETPCDEIVSLPAPTGPDAAYRGLGPELRFDWDWPDTPTPTVILESGFAPDEWAVQCSFDVQRKLDARGVKVFVEPYTSFALSIYPN